MEKKCWACKEAIYLNPKIKVIPYEILLCENCKKFSFTPELMVALGQFVESIIANREKRTCTYCDCD